MVFDALAHHLESNGDSRQYQDDCVDYCARQFASVSVRVRGYQRQKAAKTRGFWAIRDTQQGVAELGIMDFYAPEYDGCSAVELRVGAAAYCID